jgi:hypothetical protein
VRGDPPHEEGSDEFDTWMSEENSIAIYNECREYADRYAQVTRDVLWSHGPATLYAVHFATEIESIHGVARLCRQRMTWACQNDAVLMEIADLRRHGTTFHVTQTQKLIHHLKEYAYLPSGMLPQIRDTALLRRIIGGHITLTDLWSFHATRNRAGAV